MGLPFLFLFPTTSPSPNRSTSSRLTKIAKIKSSKDDEIDKLKKQLAERGVGGAPKSAEEMMAQVKEQIAHSKEMDEAEKAKILEEAKRKSSG